MSSDIIYTQFDDKFSESSTVIGVDKTREEYLKLFSRASYSPLYDRPYSSPISGLYNAVNSTTSLILLNQRFKNSHLREQVLPEELANPIPQNYDYESFIVADPIIPKIKPKPKPIKKRHSSHIPIDPYRHFESIIIFISQNFLSVFIVLIQGQTKYWHNRRCSHSLFNDNTTEISNPEATIPKQSHTPQIGAERSSSFTQCRSKSSLIAKEKLREELRLSTDSFCQYYHDLIEKTTHNDLDQRQQSNQETSKTRIKSSGTPRKVPLTKGQQVYLLGKYHIYDIKDSKTRRTNSYAQVLSERYKTDYNCKPQYRLNEPRDYSKYSKYIHVPRSLSPLTPKKSIDLKNPSTHRSFTVSQPKARIESEPKQILI